MASLCCNNQVSDSCFSYVLRGRSSSKAQACLEKILRIISTVPPPPPSPPAPPPPCENHGNPFKKRGFDIDLNLRLGSFVNGDESEEKSESLAENSFVGQNPDGEEELLEKTGTVTATTTDVSSDVTEMQKSEESKSGANVEVKTAEAFNDSLDLLIEAAEMISERDCCVNEKHKELAEEEAEKSGGSMKRNNEDSLVNAVEEEGFVEFEDTSPVVRSKRGRSQVLPHRFRDSVLEPWKKRPQTHRSAAAAAVSKRKRRSR